MGIYGLLFFFLLVSAALSANFRRCSEVFGGPSYCICDENGYFITCEQFYRPPFRPQNEKRSRARFSGRIVGGSNVNILKHPYMLGVEHLGRLYCGATIIGSWWAITAAHCVSVRLIENLKLRALTNKLQRGGHTFLVTGYIAHPEYNTRTQENDIALLQVGNSFLTADSRLTPIKLPEPNDELPEGTMGLSIVKLPVWQRARQLDGNAGRFGSAVSLKKVRWLASVPYNGIPLVQENGKPFSGQAMVGTSPSTDRMQELQASLTVTVVGWGHTSENGMKSDHLQEVTLPIVPHEYCNSQFNGLINNSLMICAGPKEGGKDACQADSGGPLVYNNTLYGIVSFGKGCGGKNIPGVYTKVAGLRQWIKDIANI